MKISKSQFKQIIKEEVQILIAEDMYHQGLLTEEELNEILKSLKKLGKRVAPYAMAGMIGAGAVGSAPSTVHAGQPAAQTQTWKATGQVIGLKNVPDGPKREKLENIFKSITTTKGHAIVDKVEVKDSKGNVVFIHIMVSVTASSEKEAKIKFMKLINKAGGANAVKFKMYHFDVKVKKVNEGQEKKREYQITATFALDLSKIKGEK